MNADTLCLIDSKNLCYRAHWVHRFLSSRGRCTSVLFGALKMLAAAGHRLPFTAFCFVWDGEGKTWRHEITKGEYKGHRQGPIGEDLAPAFPQLPILRKATTAAGFRNFYVPNLECDDLIGILAHKAIEDDLFKKVIIYSTDKDFYQLATKRVGVMRGKFLDEDGADPVMYADAIEQEIELSPVTDWIKVKALTGEPTDNIPKVEKGLGPKTAIKMIQAGLDPAKEKFTDHQWVVRQNFQALASRWPMIRMNYALSRIVTSPEDVHLPQEVKENLSGLVPGLTKEKFLKDKRKLGDESFSDFTSFIAEYEMNDLLSQRHELWRLP